ncbi:MAG: putative Ig domain-containing protein [Woeseia sp.]
MKHSGAPFRFLALVVALATLAGCKVSDEEDAAEPTADGSPPSIWGDPETAIAVGSQYVFVPESDDADGDVLTFEIANKPAWADFDESSGQLQGIPAEDDVGTAENIVISVTDVASVVSLPSFSITVDPVGPPPGGGGGGGSSSPPTISGQPNDSVVVDTMYSFQPNASDPDGDTLSFSIVNKPAWAGFNTVTGRLEGTPDSGDLGTTDDIELSVTDGSTIDSLNPFSITVEAAGPTSYTVSWTPPALNDDGTPLSDLAGYRIYYGTVSGEYNEVVEVNSPGITSYQIDNLSSGIYFLVMTSVNSADVESVYSGELSFELGL